MESNARGVHPMTGSFLMDGKLRRLGVIGPKCVGKSSVILRFSEDIFEEHYTPTIEDLFLVSTNVEGVAFNCEVLDSAGQDEVSKFGGQLTIGVHGYLLIFSLRGRETFDLIQHVNHNLLVSLGGQAGQSVPRVLVGNQSDAVNERTVSREEAEALAHSLRMPYVECSALSGEGVTDAFHVLLKEVERLTAHGAEPGKGKKKCVIS
eukprot:Plantae.Rhodophyta-Purpureofilum_apyrenoidigerum.ctg3778.p1 GENE.Plantae.Rhodophyta-Purpureofilum_apyrenoidigerum.ctg3778~~Plantae.Rhodophyta-Purpureofilum_apyrenoidigerum.ctg3778.p1  ORF type:complete len:206 (-),score=26.41 Plantae.Rhodophyta-Purpureofilum_apyrenoidigerum.ctg3778:386-1003(-)